MIFLRHGQSEFNLHFTRTRVDPGIIDPKLTPLGHEQAEAAAEALARRDIRRIVVSPYTRALQTAAPVARRLALPLTVTPLVRERYAFACDIGSPASALRASFPDHGFHAVDEVWWPAEEEPAEQVVARVSPGATIRYGSGNKGWVGDVPRFRYSVAKLQALGWTPQLGSEAAVKLAIEQIALQEQAG